MVRPYAQGISLADSPTYILLKHHLTVRRCYQKRRQPDLRHKSKVLLAITVGQMMPAFSMPFGQQVHYRIADAHEPAI